MRLRQGLACVVGSASLMLCGVAALADTVAVNLTNDSTDAIVLTVYDTSLSPRAVVLSQRVSGFSTIPVNVSQDATGHANLAWTAVTVDPNNRRCGHARSSGLGDSASVNVHADADCATKASAVSYEES